MKQSVYTRRLHIVCSPEALDRVQAALIERTGEPWSFVDPHDDGMRPNGYFQCSAQVTEEVYAKIVTALEEAKGEATEVEYARGVAVGVDADRSRPSPKETAAKWEQKYAVKEIENGRR